MCPLCERGQCVPSNTGALALRPTVLTFQKVRTKTAYSRSLRCSSQVSLGISDISMSPCERKMLSGGLGTHIQGLYFVSEGLPHGEVKPCKAERMRQSPRGISPRNSF